MTLLLQMSDMTNPLISFPYAFLHPDNMSVFWFLYIFPHLFSQFTLYYSFRFFSHQLLASFSFLLYSCLLFSLIFLRLYIFSNLFSIFFLLFSFNSSVPSSVHCARAAGVGAPYGFECTYGYYKIKKLSVLNSSWNLTFKNRASYI